MARPLLASIEVRLVVLVSLVIIAPLHAHAGDCEQATMWRDGHHDGTVCRDDAAARGLTVIDVSENWTPRILEPAADGTQPAYRPVYLALAQERFAEAGADAELAEWDRYLELFGISPSFEVVRARLADDVTHACHAEIDDAALERAPELILRESKPAGRARIKRARLLRAKLERVLERRGLADLEELAATDEPQRRAVDLLAKLEDHIAAVRAVQAHLTCDGLLRTPEVDGAYTAQTRRAVKRFQRGSMILPSGRLDTQTREALMEDSRERAFRTALRVLRERVAAATGLVEDGTAGDGPAPVLGRLLEPTATTSVRGHAPLPDAAPDLISPATEAAALALGWLDAESTLASLAAMSETTPSRVVAIALPALPPYHQDTMQLEVEIDRGHVSRVRGHRVERRPALILYARDGERRIPLVRWPTTIGGWQREKVGRRIENRWKGSPVGRRIWRDLFVGPSWLPPPSTPDEELVRTTKKGTVLAREIFGPSYRAAYGMVAFFHRLERPGGATSDQGIRTHGTGSLASLANGASHGCHRLLGFHAVRLASFILEHRDYVRRGPKPTSYQRTIRHRGRFPVAIDSVGYRIELVPPIEVNVLPGRIHPGS